MIDDPKQCPTSGDFALNLENLIGQENITTVIETGGYIGLGSTTIIANALKAQKDTMFLSIEVSPECIEDAKINLQRLELDHKVRHINALSIPRSLEPEPADIEELVVGHVNELREMGIAVEVEFDEIDRTMYYYLESAHHADVPDDGLKTAFTILKKHQRRPELILLDSAGHLGFIEFQYLISLLRNTCYIALDDVFHIKHIDTFCAMKGDPRFDIRALGMEKNGYLIAKFTPRG